MNIVERVADSVKIRNIIVSVSDKSGLEEFIPGLVRTAPGITLFSTGGTFTRIEDILSDAGLDSGPEACRLVRISEYTGQPEMQGGLVKTLDFKIYLGLLSEPFNSSHEDDLKRTNAVEIDMVAANLYPFQNTVADRDCTLERGRSNIDIGGPCMLRASAKNYLRVASVCDPADYPAIIDELESTGGALTLETRFELARKSFAHTAAYDAAIAAYLAGIDPQNLDGEYTVDSDKGGTE
ncbi:MAG: hypothetical protein ACLFRY_02405 [Spirochaetia bacterium]